MKEHALPPLPEAQTDVALLSGFATVLLRDLRLAARQRSDLVYPMFFFLMVVSLFPLGLGPEPRLLAKVAPGILWIAALLSTLLASDGLFRQDHEDGSLEVMLASPQSTGAWVLAKVLAHWLVASVPLLLLAPLLALMLHLPSRPLWVLEVSLLLGTPVLSLVTAIGASLTLGLRRGHVLVALISLPLYVPVLIFAVGGVDAAATGAAFDGHLAYLAALLALALTGAPFAIGAGLRISVVG